MLTSVFGISIKYEAWNHQDSLPVYIAGSYDFHTAYIGNRRCIMLAPTEELATLPALKKQIVKIQQIDNVPVVFELTTVSNYRRKSLIENNIPFIIQTIYGIWMFFAVLIWDIFIVYILSLEKIKEFFNKYIYLIEKISAVFISFVALTIIYKI